ncbi:MAG: dihydroxyacetone kinase subunit DhaK, partial [Nakamurella sp.]
GGSGHEPLHVGYVGAGMLDAAVPGAMFTSPTPDQILDATTAVNGGAGILHIVKNYTGDVLNFEMAAELAAAEGLEVSTVIVDDDVAVQDSTWTAGRRGVGGTVLLEKIAGAAAARRSDLAAVTAIATRVNANVRSMGMALRACTVPHSGEPSFNLAADEMEIGIGIHGEPGRETRTLAPADEIVEILLSTIVEDLPFRGGDRTLLFVNGMGGTPEVELYLAYNSARKYLAAKGIEVTRSLVGNYITALEMQGMSITLLRLDDEFVELWDAPVHTVALRRGM